MKIWQCTRLDLSGVGGVEKHIAEVSAGLVRLGHEVHTGRSIPKDWLTSSAGPVVMHTHGDLWPNLALLTGKARKSLLWVHVCHGTSVGRVIACREFMSISGWRGSVADFLPAQFADAVVAVGQHALDEARMYFRMKLPSAVIANGADPAVFRPSNRAAFEPLLIYVGRDGDRVKNVPAIVEAAAAVAETTKAFQLLCAPGIDYDYAVHPFIRNLGPLSGQALAAAMARCRALVLCSFYEGDPIVLHEAQSMGLQVVASDIRQLRDSLQGYANAIFVNPRSISSMSFGMRTAVSGPPVRPAPRIRDWTTVAREFDAFYRKLIEARK